ncbi:hypothetical protein DID88_005693 [Monilinia fructigena]|uniref:Ankyrin repeat protein n=1 Tax=Monilinia fructigena TaxID=38457 RepID=A0A395J0K7_9HELO|nr:hypothetical protein DID88_005693 [Monilinia fructigena]
MKNSMELLLPNNSSTQPVCNNVDLMKEILGECKSEEEAAELLNNAKDRNGNYVYHIAAGQGLYDMIDWLTTQEGFECDPISRSSDERAGRELVELMLEAGSEKGIKNKQGHTPVTLVSAQNPELKNFIKDYEFDDGEDGHPAPGKQESNYLDYDEVAGEEDDRSSV